MEADRTRLYAKNSLEELVVHLRELKKAPEWECETIAIQREDKKSGKYNFTEQELNVLCEIAPLISEVNSSSETYKN